jgi:hypothetical protein
VLGLVHAVPRRLLDVASRAFAWSSWSAPSGCLPVRYLYIHEKTDSAATPRPPEVMNPAAMSASTMAAGTSTGLKMTSTGVATVSAMTVPARISPDSTSIDLPKVAAKKKGGLPLLLPPVAAVLASHRASVLICHYGFVRLSYQARALLAVYALATTLRASEVDEGPGSAVNLEGARSRELARPRGAHEGLLRAPSDTCGGVAASAALLGRYLRGFWTSRGRPCGCLDLPWAELLLHLVKF